MGIMLVKTKNIFKIKKTEKTQKKEETVILDGCSLKKDSRVTICIKCGKLLCHTHNHQYMCTSAQNWYNIKKKYKYKFLGNYRLKLYIRKCELETRKEYIEDYSK